MYLPRPARVLVPVSLVIGLAGCTLNTLPRPMPIVAAPGAMAPVPAAGMAGAETACTNAGRERGLDVLGVASTRDVVGADGAPERDVMLRVARSGTQLEVRCNFRPDSGVARIMLI